jgi:hypothetical protein
MNAKTFGSLAAAAVAALVHIAPPAADAGGVYRCNADGRIEYTDRPCGDANAVTIDPGRAGIVLAQMHAVDANASEPSTAAPVVPGMSPKAVYATMGRPRDMNVRLEGITPTERWWYRTPDGMLTVTFKHGRVATVATQ